MLRAGHTGDKVLAERVIIPSMWNTQFHSIDEAQFHMFAYAGYIAGPRSEYEQVRNRILANKETVWNISLEQHLR